MNNLHLISNQLRSYVLGKTSTVCIDGQHWKYLEQGSGQPILFLPGLGGNIALWRGMMQSYDNKEYRRISLDIPGFCMHQYFQHQKHTVQSTARWLDLFLDKLDIDSAHIVAHSTACCLAIYYGSTRSERVKNITLISLPDIIRPGNLKENPVVKDYFNDINIQSLEDWQRYYYKLFHKPPLSPTSLKQYSCKMHMENHEKFMQTAEEFMPSLSAVMTHTSRIKCPVLAINAFYDPYSNPEHRASLNRHFKHLTNVCLDNAGHISFIEKQKEVARLHHNFLNQHKTDSALNLEQAAS